MTMNPKLFFTVPCLMACLFVAGVQAQVPSLINYQGRLLDSVGNPVSSNSTVSVAIHTNITGGVAVYSEAIGSVLVNNGLFSFQFGGAANFTTALAKPEAWLEVTVDSTPMDPRQRLVAVPYAMVAGSAESAESANVALSIAPAPIPPAGMVLIPAGPYIQGDSLDGLSNAQVVTTTVSAVYMDAHEVSSNQWASVKTYADANGYGFTNDGLSKGAYHPVHTVSWYDCVKWCNARSQQAGKTPVYYTDAGFTQVYTNGEVTVYPIGLQWVIGCRRRRNGEKRRGVD